MNIGVLFSGQGSPIPVSCIGLYNDNIIFRKTLQEASEIVGYDVPKLCMNLDKEFLFKTENAQSLILILSVAVYRSLKAELDLEVVMSAGHSLGEISALTCAGAIDFPSAVKLTQVRGKIMQEVSDEVNGGMLAFIDLKHNMINWLRKECECYQAIGKEVYISNINSDEQIVLSGKREILEKIADDAHKMELNVINLNVTGPFHCTLMQGACKRFKTELEKLNILEPHYKVISNINGIPYTSKDEIIQRLSDHLVCSVQWKKTIEFFDQNGIDIAYEIGTKNYIKKLTGTSNKYFTIESMHTTNDILEVKKNLLKKEAISKEILKKKVNEFISNCISAVVCTKNYNWNNEQYENGVVKQYQKLCELQKNIEENGSNDTYLTLKKAYKILKLIFDTKMVPSEEQRKRFDDIFNTSGLQHIRDNVKI